MSKGEGTGLHVLGHLGLGQGLSNLALADLRMRFLGFDSCSESAPSDPISPSGSMFL